MLGHAKASMTLDTHTDLFDTDLDAVAVELDMAIKAAAAQADRGSKLKAAAGPLPVRPADSGESAN